MCTVCGTAYTPKHVRKDAKYCSVGCNNKAASARRKAAGPQTSTCHIDGCDRKSRWKRGGPCSMHYRRIRLTGSAGSVGAVRGGRMGVAPCSVDGCRRKYYANGLCSLHYNRQRTTGDAGEAGLRRKPASQGEIWRYVDRKGYVYLTLPGDRKRQVLEHRYVMEQRLGRPLWPDESVHHKNGNRADNRPENLELWSRWQPAGQRVEDKLAWAREIIARYEGI